MQNDLFGYVADDSALVANALSSAKGDKDPIALLMKQIGKYEIQLELLESRLPLFQNSLHEALQPIRSEIIALYKELIAWLGTQYAAPKGSRKHKERIFELACMLAEKALDVYDEDLEIEMEKAGFSEDFGDDPEMERLEKAFAEDMVDAMLEDMGIDAPEHVRAAMYEASRSGELSEEARLWLESNQGRTSEPSRKPKKGKAKKELIEPESLKKMLYRGLARDLHPDKAGEEERQHRTLLMQQLNAAYQEGDISALLKLLHAHGSEEMKAGVGPQALQMLKKELEQQKYRLRIEIDRRLEMLPRFRVDWIKLLGQESLQQQVIAQELKSAREELEELRKHANVIQEPKGLETFFKKIHPEYWDEFF